MQLSFAYDADGIRTSKTVENVVHEYVTQSGKVVRETIGTGTTARVLDFIYDASGRPFALIYTNGTAASVTYYYVLNLQGDVVGLIDENADFVAKYTYNAWGEILTSSGTMSEINPLRYRGYYYDTETGFYYLQSRYYDPAMHRFINADSLASTGQGIIGTNMFAYCLNNPVGYIDDTGSMAISFVNGNECGLFGGGGRYDGGIIPTGYFLNALTTKTGSNQKGWTEVGAGAKTLCSQEAIDTFCDVMLGILLVPIIIDALIQSMELEISVGQGVSGGVKILNIGVEAGANFDCVSFSYSGDDGFSFGMEGKVATSVSLGSQSWEYGFAGEWKNGNEPSFRELHGESSFTLFEVKYYNGAAGATFSIGVDTNEFWKIIRRAFER